MVEDKEIWMDVLSRITTTMTRTDFKVLCRLHAKYFDHKYTEFCTCNKKKIRMWIEDLNNYFSKV
jgi:hypothetical protein